LQADSKNDDERRVVLSSRAKEMVLRLARDAVADDGRLFPLAVHTVENRWQAASKAAKVTGLTLHELRHVGLSWIANRGLNIAKLQQQGGQRTPAVLMRYVNQKVSEVG
jgi:integrase